MEALLFVAILVAQAQSRQPSSAQVGWLKPFWLKHLLFELLSAHGREEGFSCVSGIFRSITVGDAKFETMEAEWQSSWVEHPRRSSASSLAPRFARSPSTVSSMATCASPAAIASAWAHRSERGSEVDTETDHEDCRTSSFRGCVRETVPGERPCDDDQTCTSSFGRHRRSRSRWVASSVEARRVRHEGDAHPHASEGVRVIFAKASIAHGGARPEARRGGSQFQRCREETGRIEVAGGVHACASGTARCRGAEVAGTCVPVVNWMPLAKTQTCFANPR